MSPTVADCERVQLSWFQLRADVLGGESWEDGGLRWVDGNLLFPQVIDPRALARGIERSRALGSTVLGAWLGLDVDASPLAAAGFEKGWSPWWMAGPVPRDVPADPRVRLQEQTTDYSGEHSAYARELAMARLRPTRAWYAAAYTDGWFAGRAWSHRVGDLAGVFDVDVWPPFQRRGLGTALMHAVCGAAASAGARDVVLNSTPAGVRLYERCGLRRIGTGITWWLHPRSVTGQSPGASQSL
ncbi:GNAT family N-acetyltransferase [Cellulomonas fengjieae]|uniref:GNAT family N-acetyltransferase n=1 Tax=Cellulomonas fengjieae TaxID=2819978 RepID=UPI001AAE3748|nr:GNAT family N-acetyltransferase [Cellulomonas fengjieae]MBO3101015.1 GNAT family N-acetyltransferase [Cellulomonas fengjieae]